VFPHLYSAVGHILVVIPVLGGQFSAHSCNSHDLYFLAVTPGSGKNGRNFSCNMGATQPIRIFHPLPSHKSTQLCGFAIFSTHVIMLHAVDLLPSSLPPPFHLPPSVFFIIVWMGGQPALNVWHSMHPVAVSSHQILCPYPRMFRPVIPHSEIHISSFSIFWACYCLQLKFLKFLLFILLSGVRSTNFVSTVYAFIACEELLESTTIYLAHELCSI